MNEKQVYCKDCKHYSWFLSVRDFKRICGYEKKRNYFGETFGVPCIQKNKNFDCKDYRKKWYKL
jgi:hypothetical protein